MNDSLSGAVTALRMAGEMLAEAANRLPSLGAGPAAFGATAYGAARAGRLGDVATDLHSQCQHALDARAREAAAHAARLDDAADAIARAARDYADVDSAARQRRPETT